MTFRSKDFVTWVWKVELHEGVGHVVGEEKYECVNENVLIMNFVIGDRRE